VSRRAAPGPQSWRIGEVAKLTGLTARTLRYWEELGLLSPTDRRDSGERLYSDADIARVNRIRELQDLLGFSLSEVRTVLDLDEVEVLDRVRSELRGKPVSKARRRELLEEGVKANDQLLQRLDETLARIQAFRDERAAKGHTIRAKLAELD
jgi:DNA-binding transcriptional MerR regulator